MTAAAIFLEPADMWAIRGGMYYFLSFSDDEDLWTLNRSEI